MAERGRRARTVAEYQNGNGPHEDLDHEVSVDQSEPQTEPTAPPFELADQYGIRELADALISEYHVHLEEATITYAMEGKEHRRGGAVIPGRVIKLQPIQRWLDGGKGEWDGSDFLVLIARKSWLGNTDSRWREALLDSLLWQCWREETERGNTRWVVRAPDFSGSVEVVQRRGAWNEPLQQVADAVMQLRMDLVAS